MLPREVQLVLVKLKRSELVPQTSALVSFIIVLNTLPLLLVWAKKCTFDIFLARI